MSRTFIFAAVLVGTVANQATFSGGRAVAQKPPSPTPAAAPTPDGKTPNPVAERAEALREAAGLLEKAGGARDRGNRSFAEQLFSSAEIIVGPEALADVAELFRKGAPPRIATPLKKLPMDTPPQPAAAGSSDEDEPEAKPLKGSLSGTVTLDGKATEGLSVVTLEPASGKWRHRRPRQRIMEQRNRQFAPRVLVVPVGSTVTFPNFDSVYHNVFSTTDFASFDLGIYKNGQSRDMVFDKEGIVSLGCNLHANMNGHIVVVSAPHYVVTDGAGKFTFQNLEPGSYRLRAWNEHSLKPVVQELAVKPERNSVSVKVKSDAPSGPLPDKFGVSRGAKP